MTWRRCDAGTHYRRLIEGRFVIGFIITKETGRSAKFPAGRAIFRKIGCDFKEMHRKSHQIPGNDASHVGAYIRHCKP